MLFTQKREIFPFREFLADRHIEKKASLITPLYSFIGIDITHKSLFDAQPVIDGLYALVFGLGFVAIGGTMLENYFASKGDIKAAKRVSLVLNIGLPVITLLFTYFGVVKTF